MYIYVHIYVIKKMNARPWGFLTNHHICSLLNLARHIQKSVIPQKKEKCHVGLIPQKKHI